MTKKRPKVPGTTIRPVPPHKRVCLTVGNIADPIVAVAWRKERTHPRDSGYMLFTSSAPTDPDECVDDDYGTYCLRCLVKAHPEAERGLTLAQHYGYAQWEDEEGEWIADDGHGNEVVFDSGDQPTDGKDQA